MKFMNTAIALSLVSTLMACAETADTGQQSAGTAKPIAAGELTSSDGKPVGAVKIISEGGAVRLVAAASGLPDGMHGFHLHQTGDCNRPDFKSAGGHLNPLEKSHGSESPDGSHLGDLPNLMLTADDTAPQTFTLEGNETQISAWLFDDDGTAVVIHADPDDYKTDPSGAAGARIACAVLTAS